MSIAQLNTFVKLWGYCGFIAVFGSEDNLVVSAVILLLEYTYCSKR